ncbi:hypothetical protein OG394_07860 [Kribbella sp. NBC_01245]|uniref:hypothetical protein n=1 Tax=Kribbella sp. NBC_01245 TaxID=2903578 RepID=UPI002E2A9ED1|nr:hypothetical protein [Kribbella sp. NBC_01245]
MSMSSQKSAELTGGERVGVACAGMMAALLVAACASVAIALSGSLGSLVIGVAVGGIVGAGGLYWFSVANGLGHAFGLTTAALLTLTGLFGVFPSLDHPSGLVILLTGLLLSAVAAAMLTDRQRAATGYRAIGVLTALIALAIFVWIFSIEHTWFDV